MVKIRFDYWAMMVTALIFRSAIFVALLIPFTYLFEGKPIYGEPVNYLKNILTTITPLVFMTLVILVLFWTWVWENKVALLIFGGDFLFWAYIGMTTYFFAGTDADPFWVLNYFFTYTFIYGGLGTFFLLIRLTSHKLQEN